MEKKSVISSLLGIINDRATVHTYGDGFLLDLPIEYGDGDAVRLLIEPMGDGLRVSDRAEAANRLAAANINLDTGRAAEAFAETVHEARLSGINASPGEIATYGRTNDLGSMILSVAQASLRADQLRWLATHHPAVRYADQVLRRVRAWAGERWEVRRDAPMQMRSGRTRPVTLAVAHNGDAAYVQALSRREPDRQADHCFALFASADVDKNRRIAALDGRPDQWADAIVSELATVSDVEFFDSSQGLERKLNELAYPPNAVLQGR